MNASHTKILAIYNIQYHSINIQITQRSHIYKVQWQILGTSGSLGSQFSLKEDWFGVLALVGGAKHGDPRTRMWFFFIVRLCLDFLNYQARILRSNNEGDDFLTESWSVQKNERVWECCSPVWLIKNRSWEEDSRCKASPGKVIVFVFVRSHS